MPDIHYTIGHPGKSALDCIVPGVELLCKNPWVDRENIGIQGQSWGGYQVAYMVTQPQVFKWKAAGAGAPVSNMTVLMVESDGVREWFVSSNTNILKAVSARLSGMDLIFISKTHQYSLPTKSRLHFLL